MGSDYNNVPPYGNIDLQVATAGLYMNSNTSGCKLQSDFQGRNVAADMTQEWAKHWQFPTMSTIEEYITQQIPADYLN